MPTTLGSTGVTFPDNTTQTSASKIINNFPLAATTSVTAGKLASVNSSGAVGTLPVLNTLGSEYTNSASGQYTVSTDGSRAITSVSSALTLHSSPTATIQFTGIAWAGSATPTVGTTSVTVGLSVSSISYSVTVVAASLTTSVRALNATQFLCSCSVLLGTRDIESSAYMASGQTKFFIITVDALGNLTKGTELVNSNNNYTANFSHQSVLSLISPTIATARISYNSAYNQTFTLSISGTTVSYVADAEAASFFNGNGVNCVVTSSNVIVCLVGTTLYTATIAAGNIGAVTTTAVVISNAHSSSTPVWFKINNTDRFIVHYKDTNQDWRLSTYTVNQTTGTLTLVSTSVDRKVVPQSQLSSAAFKSNTEGVFIYSYYVNSISLDANANILGTNMFATVAGIPPETVQYNSSNLFYLSYYNTTLAKQQFRTYNVNAHSTNLFSYVGVAQTTSSTTPVPIVVAGVANGFSGLTPNAIYYASTLYDGTVTTSSLSGILIGKAISSTEILMGYSA